MAETAAQRQRRLQNKAVRERRRAAQEELRTRHKRGVAGQIPRGKLIVAQGYDIDPQVREGESWFSLARRIYGDPRMAQILRQANMGIQIPRKGMFVNIPQQRAQPFISPEFMGAAGATPTVQPPTPEAVVPESAVLTTRGQFDLTPAGTVAGAQPYEPLGTQPILQPVTGMEAQYVPEQFGGVGAAPITQPLAQTMTEFATAQRGVLGTTPVQQLQERLQAQQPLPTQFPGVEYLPPEGREYPGIPETMREAFGAIVPARPAPGVREGFPGQRPYIPEVERGDPYAGTQYEGLDPVIRQERMIAANDVRRALKGTPDTWPNEISIQAFQDAGLDPADFRGEYIFNGFYWERSPYTPDTQETGYTGGYSGGYLPYQENLRELSGPTIGRAFGPTGGGRRPSVQTPYYQSFSPNVSAQQNWRMKWA
jgi:hypothetical protein